MSNSPSWPAHLSPQSQKPSTSWTLPTSKITSFWENTKKRNLTRWSSKSRMLGLLWRSVNGVSLRINSPKNCHKTCCIISTNFTKIDLSWCKIRGFLCNPQVESANFELLSVSWRSLNKTTFSTFPDGHEKARIGWCLKDLWELIGI